MAVIEDNPLMSRDRYRISGEKIYDTWGGYYIDPSLWERWRREGRSDKWDHDFLLGDRVPDSPLEIEQAERDNIDLDRWHRVSAVCLRCGQERQVWWGVNLSDLNRGWCIKPPSFWGRLFRRV